MAKSKRKSDKASVADNKRKRSDDTDDRVQTRATSGSKKRNTKKTEGDVEDEVRIRPMLFRFCIVYID